MATEPTPLSRAPAVYTVTNEVQVSLFPVTSEYFEQWSITVTRRGMMTYAVCHGPHVLNNTGEWECEPVPSRLTPSFVARTRYLYAEAFQLACMHADTLRIDGKTAHDLLTATREEA